VAAEVASGILAGLEGGTDPWAALARGSAGTAGLGPPLGRPASREDQEAQKAAAALQRLAFVTWVG